uniref:Ion transport domain-containing protein n=1 Tax=Periophthalmus magnuspinnatus TaxID=409849 RepID=A0A3B4A6H2_9GOBI
HTYRNNNHTNNKHINNNTHNNTKTNKNKDNDNDNDDNKNNDNDNDDNLASVFVSDAQFNRNIFFDSSPQAVRLYMLYNHWGLQVTLYIFILVDLSLALFEEPAVLPLPLWATMSVELLCVVVFMARLVHYAKVIPRDKFWKDPKNLSLLFQLTLLDMLIYGSLRALDCSGVRWSRVFRPLLLVNITEGRRLRQAFRSIRNALPQILLVFLLFIFSILIFSLMALKLFSKRGLRTTDGAPYFTNFLQIVFDLYVLVTTANSPDVMMPAYNSSSIFSIFFIIFILVNVYIFMSVFLAVVYNNYKKHLKEEVRQLVRAKRHKMARAFAVLQQKSGEGAEPVVTHDRWSRLVRRVRPDISHAHKELLWSVCDPEEKGVIGKLAFVQLADLLNIEVITVKQRPHPLQNLCPALYLSKPSRLLSSIVQHRGFVILFDLIILANAVFIALDEENPLISNSEWFFLVVYLLEILLKLYVHEPRGFFSRHNFWNWFDTIIVVAALIATIVNSALKSSSGYTSRQVLDIVFILRVLRLIRVVDSIDRFRAIINTLIRIGPAILTFGQLILVVYYIFAMVGMELFQGRVQFFGPDSEAPERVYCGNPLLKDTAFARHNYCKNNFNQVVASFVLLLELTVVNQCSGFSLTTHPAARLYFLLFHITVVIIIINIFVAFVLEAFFVEYSVEKSDLQNSVEKKIEELQLGVKQEKLEQNLVNSMETMDSENGPKKRPALLFKIASRRYRTVDALIQRMFENDLNPEDFNEDETNGNFSNPTFNL